MHGPFLPIYGSGAVMMLVASAPYQDNLALTFVSGMIGATLLELVTGILMEALFKVRYWDYSSKKFNYRDISVWVLRLPGVFYDTHDAVCA